MDRSRVQLSGRGDQPTKIVTVGFTSYAATLETGVLSPISSGITPYMTVFGIQKKVSQPFPIRWSGGRWFLAQLGWTQMGFDTRETTNGWARAASHEVGRKALGCGVGRR
jgi:hypothetical protein